MQHPRCPSDYNCKQLLQHTARLLKPEYQIGTLQYSCNEAIQTSMIVYTEEGVSSEQCTIISIHYTTTMLRRPPQILDLQLLKSRLSVAMRLPPLKSSMKTRSRAPLKQHHEEKNFKATHRLRARSEHDESQGLQLRNSSSRSARFLGRGLKYSSTPSSSSS